MNIHQRPYRSLSQNLLAAMMIIVPALSLWAPNVLALPNFFSSNGCSNCHTPTSTFFPPIANNDQCSSCHEHATQVKPKFSGGTINFSASAQSVVATGSQMAVNINGGNSKGINGQIRVAILNSAGTELFPGMDARISQGPSSLTVTAPATVGLTNWKAANRGSGTSGPPSAAWGFSSPPHGEVHANFSFYACNDNDNDGFFSNTCPAPGITLDCDDNAASPTNTCFVNTPPIANAGIDQTVTAGDLVPLNGSASSDADSDPLTYSWTLITPAGSTATLSDATAVMPTFTADVAGIYSADLMVNDGTDNSGVDSVLITAGPGNTAPIANAGPDQPVTAGDAVTLDGSGSSDADGNTLSYSWILNRPAGSSATLSDPGAVMPTFLADVAGVYSADLVVNDGTENSPADSVTITASVGNTAPVANAGSDQSVTTGDTVTLDGSGSSDVDSDPLTYSWSITSKPAGSAASLADPRTVMPTFTADVAGDYIAQLIVNDGMIDSAADTVVVHTAHGNTAPIANAGPDQSVATGDTVTLDSSGSSDVDSDPLTYSWSITSKPASSSASLSDTTAAMPSFVADVAGDYVAQLIVNDGTVDSAADSVVIRAANGNAAPIANAGPDQSVAEGDTVTLDSSGSSDADSDPLTYSWSITSKPGGSSASLSNTTAAMPSFVADVAGDYVAQLIVNDGMVDSATDSVVIHAASGNTVPVAHAGPDQSVAEGDTVTLDGSASSDADSDPLTYSWSITSKPAGSAASLSDSTAAMPTFVADVAGDYVAQFIVNDGMIDSAADSVVIHAANGNTAPIANAGPDQSVAEGDTVTLDGSASNDADSDPLTYSWSITSKPAGSTAGLSDPSLAMPSFVADVAGDYVAQLIVNDGTVDSAADSVVIHAASGNTIPVANAGPNQSVNQGDTVTLDSSASSDADNDPLSYRCSFTSKPAGSTAVLSDTSGAMPTFVADMPGDYIVQFIVNDGLIDSAPDSVVVTAKNITPPPAVNISLRLKVEPKTVEKVGKPIEIHGKARLDRSEMEKDERIPVLLEVGIEKPDGSKMNLMEKSYNLKKELEFELKYRTGMSGKHKVYANILGSNGSILAAKSQYVMVVSKDSDNDNDDEHDADESDNDADKAKDEKRARLEAIKAKMLLIAKLKDSSLSRMDKIRDRIRYAKSKVKSMCKVPDEKRCVRLRKSLRKLAEKRKRINKKIRKLNRISEKLSKLT